MVSSINTHACKACNSLNISSLNIPTLPVCAQPFQEVPSDLLAFHTSLYLCDDCGHMFLDIPPVSYYKNVIRSVSVSSEMTDYRREQFGLLLSLFSKPVSELRVLEIGAGDGQYSQLLSEFFPVCFATEPNTIHNPYPHVHFIDTHPDDENFCQSLINHGPFDLICCFSYLEHLPNPLDTLCHINSLLSPGGYALIEVPNSDYIRDKGLLCEIIPDHLHYFTARSLVTLASQAQLNLQRARLS